MAVLSWHACAPAVCPRWRSSPDARKCVSEETVFSSWLSFQQNIVSSRLLLRENRLSLAKGIVYCYSVRKGSSCFHFPEQSLCVHCIEFVIECTPKLSHPKTQRVQFIASRDEQEGRSSSLWRNFLHFVESENIMNAKIKLFLVWKTKKHPNI